jgi:hypothetical protein
MSVLMRNREEIERPNLKLAFKLAKAESISVLKDGISVTKRQHLCHRHRLVQLRVPLTLFQVKFSFSLPA